MTFKQKFQVYTNFTEFEALKSFMLLWNYTCDFFHCCQRLEIIFKPHLICRFYPVNKYLRYKSDYFLNWYTRSISRYTRSSCLLVKTSNRQTEKHLLRQKKTKIWQKTCRLWSEVCRNVPSVHLYLSSAGSYFSPIQ